VFAHAPDGIVLGGLDNHFSHRYPRADAFGVESFSAYKRLTAQCRPRLQRGDNFAVLASRLIAAGGFCRNRDVPQSAVRRIANFAAEIAAKQTSSRMSIV
jgi:hypothetical protein